MEHKEQQILSIIKYSPPVFIILLSFALTLFFYFDNKRSFLEEKVNIEKNHIIENKELIQEEVYRAYSFIENLQNQTEIELKNSIKNRVYEAHSISIGIYEKYKDSKLREEIFELFVIEIL